MKRQQRQQQQHARIYCDENTIADKSESTTRREKSKDIWKKKGDSKDTRKRVTNTGCLKIDATHQYYNGLLLRQETPRHLVWVYVWSGFCMGTAEDHSLRFFATIHVNGEVLGNVFGGIFSDSLRQKFSPHPHYQDILQSTSCQVLDFLPSCWNCLLNL